MPIRAQLIKKNTNSESKIIKNYMQSFLIPNNERKKIMYVINKINTAFELLDKYKNKDNTIKWEWIIGKWFNTLKSITKGKKGLFGRLVKKYYTEISDKRREWLMKLAKNINMKKYPAFACLNKTQILTLIQVANNRRIKLMLDDNGIDVDIDIDNIQEVSKFKDDIERIIELKTIPQKIKAAYEAIEKYTDILMDNPKTIKDNPEIIKSSQATVKKLKNIISLKNKNLLK